MLPETVRVRLASQLHSVLYTDSFTGTCTLELVMEDVHKRQCPGAFARSVHTETYHMLYMTLFTQQKMMK